MRSVRADRDLSGDLKCRGDRLGEDRDLVGQRIGDGVQIALRHRDQIGEGAVVIEDAEHRAVRAVRVQPHAAGLARPARAVDLADDAAAGHRTGFGDADELVTQHAPEPHIALDQLEVGLADAGTRHAHEHFAVTRIGGWSGLLDRHTIVEHDGAHPLNATRIIEEMTNLPPETRV